MNTPSAQAEKTLLALDAEQRVTVLAPVGPVRIIVGAGTDRN